jgi:hypothetical protein
MSSSKQCIVDSECGIFQEKWTDECVSVFMNGKALCLLCSESIAVFIESNIARHYSLKHKEQCSNCVAALRRETVSAKKGGQSHSRMSSKQNPIIVPLHCGQVIVLLTCWSKKAYIFFRWGIRKKLVATHSARYLSGKGNCI